MSPTERGHGVTTGSQEHGGGGAGHGVTTGSREHGGVPKFCRITEGREGPEARDREGVRRLPFYSWFCNEFAVCPWADQFLSLTLSFLLFYNQMQNLQGFPFQF